MGPLPIPLRWYLSCLLMVLKLYVKYMMWQVLSEQFTYRRSLNAHSIPWRWRLRWTLFYRCGNWDKERWRISKGTETPVSSPCRTNLGNQSPWKSLRKHCPMGRPRWPASPLSFLIPALPSHESFEAKLRKFSLLQQRMTKSTWVFFQKD